MGSYAIPNLPGLPTKAWETLLPLLPSRGPDCDYWWNLTGLHLAAMVDAAGYPIEKQYEALLFHHTWTVRHPAAPFVLPFLLIKIRCRTWAQRHRKMAALPGQLS